MMADRAPSYAGTDPAVLLLYASRPYVPGVAFTLSPRAVAASLGLSQATVRHARELCLERGHLLELERPAGPNPGRYVWAEPADGFLFDFVLSKVLEVVRKGITTWRADLANVMHKAGLMRGRSREVRTTDEQTAEAIGRCRRTVLRSNRRLEARGALQRTYVGQPARHGSKATPSRWRIALFGRLERVTNGVRKQARAARGRWSSAHHLSHLSVRSTSKGAGRPGPSPAEAAFAAEVARERALEAELIARERAGAHR